jgi:hypothetical protein
MMDVGSLMRNASTWGKQNPGMNTWSKYFKHLENETIAFHKKMPLLVTLISHRIITVGTTELKNVYRTMLKEVKRCGGVEVLDNVVRKERKEGTTPATPPPRPAAAKKPNGAGGNKDSLVFLHFGTHGRRKRGKDG